MVVGTARELTLSPRSCAGGALVLFKISSDATKLDHVHTVTTSTLNSHSNYFKYDIIVDSIR